MRRISEGQQSKIQDPSFTAGDLRAGQRVLGVATGAMCAAVVAARTEGWSWDRIGAVLGVPGETTRRRWGPADAAAVRAREHAEVEEG